MPFVFPTSLSAVLLVQRKIRRINVVRSREKHLRAISINHVLLRYNRRDKGFCIIYMCTGKESAFHGSREKFLSFLFLARETTSSFHHLAFVPFVNGDTNSRKPDKKNGRSLKQNGKLRKKRLTGRSLS